MISANRVAFFGIKGDPFSKAAEDHLQRLFKDVDAFYGTSDIPPTSADPGVLDVDWLFSFKTKTIFRAPSIESVRLGALNFHTCSPKYPGSGGANWILYNDEPTSAITVHEITTTVDAGTILRVDTFDRQGIDTVADLLTLTYKKQLETFCAVTSAIATEGEVWLANARKAEQSQSWGSKTYRLSDLEKLKKITPDMSVEEVNRRVRATSFGRYGPYIEIHGHRFQLVKQSTNVD